MTLLATTVLALSILFLLAMGGGLFPWTVCLVAALASAAHAACALRREHPPSPRHRWIGAVYAAALAFVVLSLLPLPAPVARVTGAQRRDQNARVAATLRAAADLGLPADPAAAFSTGRNRAGAMRMATWIVACFSCLFLASELTEKQRVGFVRALCILGGALAAAGYVALRIAPQGDTLWWRYPIPHGLPGPLLCFVNRNHFAGFLAMLCPPAIGLFFPAVARKRFFTAIACLVSFAAMSAAIVLTLSRGAVVAYASGYAALLAIRLLRRRWISAACLLAAPVALAATILLAPTPDALLTARRHGTTASRPSLTPPPMFKARMKALRNPISSGEFAERLDAWTTCLSIWRSYPITGAGPNAFRAVFPQHRTSSRREFMLHAENEYAQLLAEGGSLGAFLFIAFLAAVGRGRLRDVHPAFDAVFAGLVAVAVHACFDFAPRLPVYAVTAATLIGFLLAPPGERAAETAAHPPDGPRPERADAGRLGRRGVWVPVSGLALVAVLSFHARAMRVMDSPAHLARLDLPPLARALRWSPASWHAWYYFGRECCRDGRPDSARLGERCIARAAELDPNNYLLWRELGRLRLNMGMTAAAREAFGRAKRLRHWLDVPVIPPERPNP